MHPVTRFIEELYVVGGLACVLVYLRAMTSARALQPVLIGLVVLGVLLGGGAVMAVVGHAHISGFFAIRLLAWAVFLHLPFALAGLGWLLRRRNRRAALAFGALAAALVALGFHGFLVEPTRLQLVRHEVAVAALEHPLRVAVLADLQTDRIGAHERRALMWAAQQEPDLVLVPGDLIQEENSSRRRELQAELRELWVEVGLAPPLGTIVVQGDIDQIPDWGAPFRGLPGITVTGATRTIRLPGVTISALSLRDSRNQDLDLPLVPDGLHLVVGHAPDFALGSIAADLLVAGHTHGGQVCIPGFGPLLTLSRVPRDWCSGRTELSGGGTLLVSRGVGMERHQAPRLRLFCPPEVMVIDLVPGAQVSPGTTELARLPPVR